MQFALLEEYTATVKPVAVALNVLQSEKKAYLGYLLPTVTVLLEKLQKKRESASPCIALLGALLTPVL